MRRVSPFKNGRLITVQNAEAIGTRLGLSPLASSLRNWRPAEPSRRHSPRCLAGNAFSFFQWKSSRRDYVGSLPSLDKRISFWNWFSINLTFKLSIDEMDYNRLTSSLLLLVEFLKNRFLNRISNQFSWRLAFERSSQEKRHNARPLFATSPIPPPPTATNSKPRFSSRHSSNRVTSLKRGRRILLRPWLSTGRFLSANETRLFFKHTRVKGSRY